MNTQSTPENAAGAIPQAEAMRICSEIRQQYAGKWWTFAGLQCWGCLRFSKGDPAKMCFSGRSDNRGVQSGECSLCKTMMN